VTIVEFTDFQCPTCARIQPVIEQVVNEYGEAVRLVVRDFPLSRHPDAFKAAEAAEAAREQGMYWEYVALMFRHQSALSVDHLKSYASQLGLDRQRFDNALDTGRFADNVRSDRLDGERLGIYATPAIFVNGRPVATPTYESLKTAVDTALRTTSP
jgi:protein-disulfide isomerase